MRPIILHLLDTSTATHNTTTHVMGINVIGAHVNGAHVNGAHVKPTLVTAVLVLLAMMAAVPRATCAQPKADSRETLVTVYNGNFALIKDRRTLPQAMRKGVNLVRFRDVAGTIDPTSVHFRSLTDPAARVDEQNYEFDLVDANKLLRRYIDKELTAFTSDGRQYRGHLLSYDAKQLVLAEDPKDGPIYMVERGSNIKRIQFSQLPGGLLTRPTLVWELVTAKPGKHQVEVSYVAGKIRWRADYNLVLHPGGKALDLSGWVTIQNDTGTTFPQAKIKLLTSDGVNATVNRWSWGQVFWKQLSQMAPSPRRGKDPGRTFGDYHIYRLAQATTLRSQQIKQVELISARNVPAERIYLYDGAAFDWNRGQSYWDPKPPRHNKKVQVLLRFQNRATGNLGISLPGGKCRVYMADKKSTEFIGEDAIPHTPRNEQVTLYLGDAFDMVGERKQTGFKRISDQVAEEAFEIRVRNHKTEAVRVQVLEKLYRGRSWKIIEQTHQHKALDSRSIVFPVTIAKDGEAVIRYRVRYGG